jgi:hypothetical protein
MPEHDLKLDWGQVELLRRSGFSVFRPQASCATIDAPKDSCGDLALSFCSSGRVSHGHRHGSVMHLMHTLSCALRDAKLRSKRENCGFFLNTQGRPNHDLPANLNVSSSDACDGCGTDWVAAAFDVAVVSCLTEKKERSPLLLASVRADEHAATLAESRKTSAFLNRDTDIH